MALADPNRIHTFTLFGNGTIVKCLESVVSSKRRKLASSVDPTDSTHSSVDDSTVWLDVSYWSHRGTWNGTTVLY